MRISLDSQLTVGSPYLFLMAQPHDKRGLECIWTVLWLKEKRIGASTKNLQYRFVNPITERQIWFTPADVFKLMVFPTLDDGFEYVRTVVAKAMGGKDDGK